MFDRIKKLPGGHGFIRGGIRIEIEYGILWVLPVIGFLQPSDEGFVVVASDDDGFAPLAGSFIKERSRFTYFVSNRSCASNMLNVGFPGIVAIVMVGRSEVQEIVHDLPLRPKRVKYATSAPSES